MRTVIVAIVVLLTGVLLINWWHKRTLQAKALLGDQNALRNAGSADVPQTSQTQVEQARVDGKIIARPPSLQPFPAAGSSRFVLPTPTVSAGQIGPTSVPRTLQMAITQAASIPAGSPQAAQQSLNDAQIAAIVAFQTADDTGQVSSAYTESVVNSMMNGYNNARW